MFSDLLFRAQLLQPEGPQSSRRGSSNLPLRLTRPLRRCRLGVEPGGPGGIAALLTGRSDQRDKLSTPVDPAP